MIVESKVVTRLDVCVVQHLLVASIKSTSTYLCRPMKYLRTAFMQLRESEVLMRPKGRLEWNGDFAFDTLYHVN